MALTVENPIINSPFEEPSRWWDYSEGRPVLREGRRAAGYYLRPRTRSATGSLLEEEFVALDVVNDIRARVKAWRQHGYPGTTRVTQELLAHWSRPDRERKLFFCQREAAETVIWLVEAPAADRMGLEIPTDLPSEEDRTKGYAGLKRYGCKMQPGPEGLSLWECWLLGRCSTKSITRRTGAFPTRFWLSRPTSP